MMTGATLQAVTLPSYTALAPTLILGLAALLVLAIDSFDDDASHYRLRWLFAGLGVLAAVGTGASVLFGLGVTGLLGVSALLSAGGVVVLYGIDTLSPRELLSGFATLAAVAALGSAVALTIVFDGAWLLFADQLVVDRMSLFFAIIFASVTALVTAGSYDYVDRHNYQAEFYSLVLFAATGMTLMASANGFATVFVALELASLPSYILVSFLKDNRGSVEAGLKYFLIGALSSAIFAYGISLVYGVTGSLQLNAVAAFIEGNPGTVEGMTGILGLGVLMVLGGFAFKTASVPFHFWAPEAYEGAPAPISGFLSSASKAAGFAVLFRVFVTAFPVEAIPVDWVLAAQILAVVTMTLGNFAAATQDEVKRMLAYSSIGHAGYALIGLAALTGGADSSSLIIGASMMHLLVYGFMNTGAFLFIALVEYWGLGRTFEDYNGLAKKAPIASVAMTVFMFSLAGLPPFGGFFSKLALLAATVEGNVVWLGAVMIVNSVLSLYYYSRVVRALWFEEPADGGLPELAGQPVGLYAAIVVAAVLTLVALPAFGLISESAVRAVGGAFGVAV